jgi:hypothetical protein
MVFGALGQKKPRGANPGQRDSEEEIEIIFS